MLGRKKSRPRKSIGRSWQRPAFVVGIVLLVVLVPASAGVFRSHSAPVLVRALGAAGRATPDGPAPLTKPTAVVAKKGKTAKPQTLAKPRVLHLTKAHSAVFDVRKLKSVVVKRERPEHAAPGEVEPAGKIEPDAGGLPATVSPSSIAAVNAPAAAPDSSFDGLDFATWGAGHPPDTNGDVGPTYYIQTINTSIGIYDKSNGNRVAAFTFNSFMSQGHFGNLCDTDNFGDPVVVYDSFENRWFITDFAFQLDASGNVRNPPGAFQCFAVSKTGDPVTGGWNFYSIAAPGALNDYPKFGVWQDGIYMSANLFGYPAGGSFIAPHVWALNKQQMYDGAPSPAVVDFAAPSADFTVIPANARLQTGTPPAGTPEYFTATEEFLNAQTVYKFHVDWDKISTSTFTGPDVPLASTCWPSATPANAPTTANAADVLAIRAMAQTQYSNIGGAESLWMSHTVQRGESPSPGCGGATGGSAAPRWYQINVTGGTVGANDVQSKTWDPDGTNTNYRYMPSVAVDRAGDMAMGYSKSASGVNPQIKYAGRLAGDPINTFSQTEQTLIDGTGSQSGNCGSSACIRWGDYSGMALDPNGCEFWMTNEYYVTTGLNFNTRIGSFHFPGCTTVGNGTLSGTVTDGSNPISGATIALGSRTTTTDGSGNYSFTIPAGTYPTETASKSGFDPASAATLVVPDGGTLTKNFTLSAAAQSGCFTDNSQSTFQRGIPNGCDLNASPGSVQLKAATGINQTNTTVTNSGFAVNATSWAGQTFIPSATGQVTQVDLDLFCSGCTGTTPNLTVSLRATSAGLPTGADLATATIPGFSSGSGGFFSAIFGSPVTLTAGTQYAIVFRAVSNPSVGTYAYVCSCAGTGTVNSNPYANGARVTSTNSGGTWAADTTVGGRDLGFNVWMNQGFPASATFVSSLKDANPAPGRTPTWTTLTYSATTPAGTTVKFQIAASNNQNGPFSYVGPDGTVNTFFTTSGASLSQFNGFRYLRYKATLTTNNNSVTPSVSSVQVCFVDTATSSPTTLTVSPATGTFGGTTTLSAHLTSGGSDVPNELVSFTLNGNAAGSATTNASGVASVNNASLAGINAGSYPTGLGASFAGDGSFDPSSGSSSLTVGMANQTISVTTHAPASAVFNTNFTVAANGGGSGNPVTFSSSGVCSNVGATFTMTSGTGTCTVKYDQAGNGNYNAASQVTETVNAQKASQTITVTTHAPAGAVFGTGFTVAATGGATGNAVTFSSSGACSNTGATFTMTSGTGTCSVKYDEAGDANYNAAPTVTETVNAQKVNQAITVTTHAPASAVFGTSFTVAASGGGSGNPVTFSSSGVCTNTGANFTMSSGTGTCSVKYDQAGDANYNPAPTVTETVNAQKANQTITVDTHAPASAVFGTSFGVAAHATGGVVSFSSSGTCSNSGNTFTMTSGTGTCSVVYDQAGNANYVAATTVTETVNAQKANQAITVTTHAPASATFGTSFGVAANAPGGTVTISSSGACTNTGANFTMTSGTGACTVTYDQAGNANYVAASQVTETVNAQKANQTITVTAHAPASAVFGTGFTVAASGGGSGNPVTFSSSGACSNSGATFTMTSGTGTCSVKYDQARDANYNAATTVTETVNAQTANQAITVDTHAPATAGLGTSFDVAAHAPGGVVTFSSAGSCSNSGNTFTITSGTGTCSVMYDQAGDANYNTAPTVTETVNAAKTDQAITVTTHAPASAVFGTSFTVAASGGGSDNPVTFSSSGACTNTGATFTMSSGTGTCTVKYDQAGNANFNAAPTVTETVNAAKADQAITVTTHAPASDVFGTSFTVAASGGGSGNPVTFSSSGACTNSGATFTMSSGTGTCSVKYDEAGDANYNAATTVTETVNAQKANQTISIDTHAPASAAFGTSFGVAAHASGGVVSFSSSGACSNSGNTFTMTSGTGTCSVVYDQAGDANYNAATTVTETVNAAKADQAITVTTHAPASAVFNASFGVAASGGDSGNPVTFSSSGACTNIGATFTMTSGTGTCSVTYDQVGNANYNAATTVTETVNAQTADQTITFNALPGKTYGDPDFALGATASSSLPVAYAASGNCSTSGGTVHITGAGSCTITSSQGGNANYNAAPSVPQSFPIAKKSLTITASDRSKLFGTTLTLGTTAFTTSGLVSGDGIASVTLTSAGAAAGAAAGMYPIVPSAAVAVAGTSLDNYTVNYANGTLTVFVGGVVGLNSVSIGSRNALVDSFDSSLGPYGPGNESNAVTVGSNGAITLNGATVHGDVLSTQNAVTLKRFSLVTGNVTAGTKVTNNGTVNGTVTQNSLSPVITAPAVAACSPFSAAAGISGQFTYVAAKGDLTVSAGGTATLANGAYCFHTITLSTGSVLKVNGPVSITLTRSLNSKKGSIVNTTNVPANLQIASSFNGSGGIAIAGGSSAYLRVYAPTTDVSIVGGGPVFGSFLGRTLSVANDSDVHFDVH